MKHEVDGLGELSFYPNRLNLMSEVRDLSEPVLRGLSLMFEDTRADQAATTKKYTEGDMQVEEIEVHPSSVELLSKRQEDKATALAELMSVICDPRSRMILGTLLMDSLRDEFSQEELKSPAKVNDFLYGTEDDGSDALDLPMMVGLMQGWIKANAQVFGDAGKKVMELLQDKVGDLQAVSRSTIQTETTGDSSKSPSSSPLDGDSQQSTSTDSISSSSES